MNRQSYINIIKQFGVSREVLYYYYLEHSSSSVPFSTFSRQWGQWMTHLQNKVYRAALELEQFNYSLEDIVEAMAKKVKIYFDKKFNVMYLTDLEGKVHIY